MTALPESPDLSETRHEDAIMRLVDELASAARDAGWWASAPHMANAATAAEKRRTALREQIQSALTAARAEREESRARAVQGEERETHYLALSSAALLMFAAEGRYGMCTPEWWEAHNNVMQTMRRVFFPSARTSTPAPSKGNSTQRKCPDCGRTDFAKRLSVSHVLCECGTQYWRDHLPQERKRVSLPVEGTVDA